MAFNGQYHELVLFFPIAPLLCEFCSSEFYFNFNSWPEAYILSFHSHLKVSVEWSILFSILN